MLKRIIVQGLQKKGFRFYLFDNNWTEFKKLINEIDKAYDETGKPRGSSARRVTGQTNKFSILGDGITTEYANIRGSVKWHYSLMKEYERLPDVKSALITCLSGPRLL